MSVTATAILALLVFAVSTLYATVGHGGASGDIAAMGLVGVATTVMKPMALVLNVFVASIGTYKFYRAKCFSWPLFWPFAVTSIPFAYLGGRINLPADIYRPLVGAVLLYAGYRLVRISLHHSYSENTRRVPLLIALFWGAIIGLISGLTGVGGGIFLSPLLILMHWAETRQSAGVSAAFILVNSLAGLAGHVTVVHALPRLIWVLIPPAVIGGIVGSHLGSKRLNPVAIRILLATALGVAGCKMILGG